VTVAPSDHALGLRPLEPTVAEPPLELIYREHGPRFFRVADSERVRRCVARLPRRQKLALFLHYYADLDYDAIARVLEISPGTVGKLLWDARTTLRGMLDE
jgi:DNA-directed RNA polymerase specialized sigma24 family protein